MGRKLKAWVLAHEAVAQTTGAIVFGLVAGGVVNAVVGALS